MQLFSEDATIYIFEKSNFFCPWKHEKITLKSSSYIIGQDLFFQSGP